jgi:hypothetical protein
MAFHDSWHSKEEHRHLTRCQLKSLPTANSTWATTFPTFRIRKVACVAESHARLKGPAYDDDFQLEISTFGCL